MRSREDLESALSEIRRLQAQNVLLVRQNREALEAAKRAVEEAIEWRTQAHTLEHALIEQRVEYDAFLATVKVDDLP